MNNKEEIDILEKLKTKLLEVNPSIQHSDFGSSRFPKSEKAQKYYLRDKNKNFLETPNADTKLGVGVEALRSSAAMIFNLLGQNALRINNIDFEPPKYEYEFPAIKNVKNSKHNAHLDAKEAKEFMANANKTFRPLFKEKGYEFIVAYKTFQEFKEMIDFSDDLDREIYLKLYEM